MSGKPGRLGLGAFTTGAWVQSLVAELRSHKLHSKAKRNKKQNKIKTPKTIRLLGENL